jgi:hypothetical protein
VRAQQGARPAARLELAGLALVFLLGLGAALAWLAASHRAWPGVMFEARVLRQAPMAPGTALRAWERIRGLESDRLRGPHLHLPGLAAQLALVQGGLSREERAALLAAGRRATRLALAREPADPRAWARLAAHRLIAGGPSPHVVAALRLSIYTGPAVRSLVGWRLDLARRCRAHWDSAFEPLVRRQEVLVQRRP